MTIWKRIKNLFGQKDTPAKISTQSTSYPSSNPAINSQNLIDLMQRLEKTLENAYSCEEAYALLDEYVELVATDEEAKRVMPLVKNHLDICPDCRDEFEVLLQVLKTAD